ncbi:hypothetical protein [Duganella caerulea]|uniref:hypothetical protein n=1 Tax=Duganella caerulea TaxID=2885762 RepID=UPI004037CE7B
MQIFALLVWLALLFVVAKIVNYFAKRPMFNPWHWLAGSYAFLYTMGIFVGLARNATNLAYIAGSFLPITLVAVTIGIWRAPKWRARQLAFSSAELADEKRCAP